MLRKLCNTRTKEFFRGKFEKDSATSGKVVVADQSLRETEVSVGVCIPVRHKYMTCTCLISFSLVLNPGKISGQVHLFVKGGA